MAKINYIRECRAFMALAAEERFTANEFVLWHALFELFNRNADGDDWPDGFVEISNAKLLPMTTFGCSDSGCETLRKTREKLQTRGLIQYRKGRRNALTPAYCMCYFFAEKSEPADRAETPVIIRPKGTNPGRRTGKPLGKPLGKPIGKPLGKPWGKTLDIPLNVNLNVNPNVKPGQKKLKSSGTNPRAGIATSRQPDDERSIPAVQRAGMGYDCAERDSQTSAAAYNDAWKTSAKARGAVAQRLLDQYDGQLDTKDAWGDMCEVMADGLDPGTIERVMPTRPCFSKLIARLRALVACGELGFPDKLDMQNAPRAGPCEAKGRALCRWG
jgi:hypothetical protein